MKVLAEAALGAAMAMIAYMTGVSADTAWIIWAIVLAGGIASNVE